MRIAIDTLLVIVFVLWALTLSVVRAGADPNDLGGGVFIAHHAPTALYTEGADWCEAYHGLGYGISNCEEQINTMSSGGERLWYVVAAFPLEEKVWCGTEFGFADITADVEFIEWGPCLENYLEFSYGPWPGSYSGTVVIAADQEEGWDGNFLPVYYFWTVSYSGGTVPLDVDPSVHFGGFANCEVPNQTWEATCYGVLGVDEAGQACCPDVGACCLCSGTCTLTSGEEVCLSYGGFFMGFGVQCDPNPCPASQYCWPCCVGEDCLMVTEASCEYYLGEFHPEYEDCDPNPCGPVEAQGESWGSIKSRFR